VSDSELRYTFTCPSCAGSFSISIDRIPPVQARFSCPKCAKTMDFPSRDEARVYITLQSGAAGGGPVTAPEPPAAAVRAPVPAPAAPKPEPAPAAPAAPAIEADKRFTVEKAGFEGDVYDRRALRILIRTGGINERDPIRAGDAAPVPASDLPELKSLFELRKSARVTPPSVCRKHTDQLAHYVCVSTERPICEECASEKKFGGTSVRVCDHCGGSVRELPIDLT
jgi:predicted Zn finger-like uncharacterized protein